MLSSIGPINVSGLRLTIPAMPHTIKPRSEGDKSLAKERIEIFGAGKCFVLDDFRNGKAQYKGQGPQIKRICESVLAGGPPPISLDELAATTRATFRVLDSLRERRPFEV